MAAEVDARRPGRVASLRWGPVAALTARRTVRSGVLWGYVFGIFVVASAYSYSTIYTTRRSREALVAAYGSNTAMSALFGPTTALQTVGGFTAFKVSMSLMVAGGIWGLLTSTRLLRGEEDLGRFELVLAGQATARRATVQTVCGLAAGAVALWAVTAALVSIAGIDAKVAISARSAVYLALCLAAAPLMFLSIGAVTSQLAATRRQAAGAAAGVLGVSYAVRMVADAGLGVHWLDWCSPLGWVEQLRPLRSPNPIALLPIAACTVAAAGVAVNLAGRRDLGGSVLPDHSTASAHVRLLSSPTGLAVRMTRGVIAAWLSGIALASALLGLVARSAGRSFSGSAVSKVFQRLGAPGRGANAVLGVCFLIVAVLVALAAISQLTASTDEETEGRLVQLIVGPCSRARWLASRVVVAVVVVAACGVAAGVCAWGGAASQHAAVGLTSVLGAGLNVVPPALCILGVGVLGFGVRPALAAPIAYGILGWSLLLVVVGGIGGVSHWLLDTSVLHQMSSAPAVAPQVVPDLVMVAVGGCCALVGAWAFTRRDVRSR